MDKKFIVGFMSLSIILFAVAPAVAGEVDVIVDTLSNKLMNKLVEKGVLTKDEAAEVVAETKAEVKKIIADEKKESSVPEWVQKLKVKGDFKLRYQYEKKNMTEARAMGRLRYRLGLETKVVDQVKVGAGFASGGANPRTTNQTFENSFQHPDLRLDYAYAEYEPSPSIKIVGGKFLRKEYLWSPANLFWDSDINPEGGSLHAEHAFTKNISGFLNTGVWVLEENGTADRPDPFMHYVQAGTKWKKDKLDATVAGIYYGFNGLKGTGPDWCGATNTGLTAVSSSGTCIGTLQYDYDSFGGSAEFGIAEPLGMTFVKRVALFSDYIHNVDPNDSNSGWLAGVRFGEKKVEDKNQWQAQYMYASIGKDAFPDTFIDAEWQDGKTDIRGHEVRLIYGLNKNVSVGLNYFNTERIKDTESSARRAQRVQADIDFKF